MGWEEGGRGTGDGELYGFESFEVEAVDFMDLCL